MAEGLKDFGIRFLLVEPGSFTTRLLAPGRYLVPEAQGDMLRERMDDLYRKNKIPAPGDAVKLGKIVVDAVMERGDMKIPRTYLRLPLGSDCYDEVVPTLKERLKNFEVLEQVVRSTDKDTT